MPVHDSMPVFMSHSLHACLFVCLAIPVHVVCLSFRLTVCMPVYLHVCLNFQCFWQSLFQIVISLSVLTVSVCLSVYNSNLNQDMCTDSKAYSHKHLLWGIYIDTQIETDRHTAKYPCVCASACLETLKRVPLKQRFWNERHVCRARGRSDD